MKSPLMAALFAGLLLYPTMASAQDAPVSAPADDSGLANDHDKIIYTVGLFLHRSLGQYDLTPEEIEIVKAALTDAAAGKPKLELEQWGEKMGELFKERSAIKLERDKETSRAYLETAASEAGAEKTETGLIYREVSAGTGAAPQATDTVKVHYRGTLVNGTEFDSSYERGEPAEFPLSGVIPCWTQGVQKMKIGGKARLICPADLAYGDRGAGPIPAGATLIFEVELLEIKPPQP